MTTEYVPGTALPSVEHNSVLPDALQLRSVPLVLEEMVSSPQSSVRPSLTPYGSTVSVAVATTFVPG
jgi:hypothetical protein